MASNSKKSSSISRAIIYGFITVLLIGICGYAYKQQRSLKKVSWLLGTWENRVNNKVVYESWKKLSDTEFSGMAYVLKGADTAVFERVQLIESPKGIFYIPSVKGQNDDLPVSFSLKEITDELVVFENPEHDFPQVISYFFVNPDSIVAKISGKMNDKERSISIPMKKVK